MMAKAVTAARRSAAAQFGADGMYRSLFDSFNPDSDGRISPLEVLSRLERSRLRTDDPRIAEALAGLAGGAFRAGTDLSQTLEFYFQSCSIEVDAQMLAIAAASLPSAGVCPLTDDPGFTHSGKREAAAV